MAVKSVIGLAQVVYPRRVSSQDFLPIISFSFIISSFLVLKHVLFNFSELPYISLFFVLHTVFYRVKCTHFCIENDAEKFPAHYTWKVAENGFKISFMMNKLAMIIFFLKLLLKIIFAKNHCEIQVSTIPVCALYSIKYGETCLSIKIFDHLLVLLYFQ
jgi:hypothetical protein